MRISRRSFLTAMSAFLLGACLPARRARAAWRALSDGIRVPALLFFPELRQVERSQRPAVETIGLEVSGDSGESVVVAFSTGQTLELPAELSFRELRSRGDLRTGVRLKNLASWLLEAAWLDSRSRCRPDDYPSLKSDFLKLQEQTVLDAVTAESLVRLVGDLGSMDEIGSIEWRRSEFRLR